MGIPSTPPVVSFVSLGCAKNLVDSEVMLGVLVQEGFVLSAVPDEADVVVVNTCGFLRAAETESLAHVREALQWKREGRVRAVVVAGCLPQRYGPKGDRRLHGVDGVLGTTRREEIGRVVREALERGKTPPLVERTGRAVCGDDSVRLRLTPRHTAYLRLSEGCNRRCTFCTIPAIRGRASSKPADRILDEARTLVRDGTVELNLIAQETTAWGRDLSGRPSLADLLKSLGTVRGLKWIRILYAHPASISDELIDAMADNPRVVPYLDMPIQHTRDEVLSGMKRGIRAGRQRRVIEKLRERIPGIVLRTTILVGFPGETQESFEGLMEDLETLRFERLGAFVFSPEAGTPAAILPQRVSSRTAGSRHRRVMEAQQARAFELARKQIGKTVSVLLDQPVESGVWEGRTTGDAPEIDPVIRVRGKGFAAGDIVRVTVTGADGYDLEGRAMKNAQGGKGKK